MDPYGHDDALRAMADAGLTSSHGTPAAHHPRASHGRAVEPGQSRRLSRRDRRRRRIWPRAADDDDRGRHGAGRQVFVMGAGVAGLQAIATARRLGAVVTATDVRPAAKEQVESLGAKFVAVEDEEFKRRRPPAATPRKCRRNTRRSRPRSSPNTSRSRTSSSPPRSFPAGRRRGSSRSEMVASMRPGSVIVDLAVERGGNVEGVKADEVTETGRRQDCRLSATCRAGSPPPPQASMPRTSRLPGNADRQEDQGACGQLGRRDREGDGAHARRRDRASEFQAEERGVTLYARIAGTSAVRLGCLIRHPRQARRPRHSNLELARGRPVTSHRRAL